MGSKLKTSLEHQLTESKSDASAAKSAERETACCAEEASTAPACSNRMNSNSQNDGSS
jgi:hypothetical protein